MRAITAWFWISVVLVVPNCISFDPAVLQLPNLPKGARPHDAAIFCDIEKALGRHCATDRDLAVGIRLADAAVALVEGRVSMVGLDDSPAALARCGGQMEAVLFEGPFPNGLPVCLNCGSIATHFSGDNDAACRAACYDLYGTFTSEGSFFPENPPSPVVESFCNARARRSTNFPLIGCFEGACGDGLIESDFEDPRRVSDPVVWTDLIGVIVSGIDLVRMTTGTAPAGAVSSQWITRGDGYVEYGATRNHRVGLSEAPALCGPPCPDTDASPADVDFGIDVGTDGRAHVFERNVRIIGPGAGGSFVTFLPTERFRVHVRDRGDGTATVSYAKVLGACAPGLPCSTNVFHTSSAPARYPFRVDASLREPAVSVLDARLVFMK